MSQARKLASDLSAVVTHRKSEKGKVSFYTVVSIRVGDTVAAGGTLGGKWTPQQVIAEFKKNPQDKRFTRQAAYDTAVLLCKA